MYSTRNVCGTRYFLARYFHLCVHLLVPALTKATSLEDEGIVLNVEESEEQKKEIKKESGAEHQEVKEEEKQTEQFNEPSTSSGSACPEVKSRLFCPVHLCTSGKTHLQRFSEEVNAFCLCSSSAADT